MTISEIFTTAPQQASCEAAARAFALLDELCIPYSRVEHECADTMEDCAAISDVLGTRICKNLVLCNRQKTDFYFLAMPEDKPFLTKDLSHQIGSSRLSFAPPELMEEIIRCAPGSASVLGLAYDTAHQVTLVMDREVYEAEQFACHPCRNDGSLRLKTADLLEKFLPHTGHPVTVVDLPRSEP
jgi:Ala-tRNA(Pro) deacylase